MNIFSNLSGAAFFFATITVWISALSHCWHNDQFWMFLVDFLFPPIGVLHGIWLWLGALL